MTYRYLYQDKTNRNCEGELKARDRADAYRILRQRGIRPYRIIGDDPVRWQPWAIAAGYAVLLTAVIVLSILLGLRFTGASDKARPRVEMTAAEAESFRARAEEAVYRAPEAFRYNVWKGVNARLEERGLDPIPRPEGLVEE